MVRDQDRPLWDHVSNRIVLHPMGQFTVDLIAITTDGGQQSLIKPSIIDFGAQHRLGCKDSSTKQPLLNHPLHQDFPAVLGSKQSRYLKCDLNGRCTRNRN